MDPVTGPPATTPVETPEDVTSHSRPSESASVMSSASTLLPPISHAEVKTLSSSRDSSVIASDGTTSSSHEKLPMAESKLEQLHLSVAHEYGSTARLDHEGRESATPFPMTSQLSLHQLKQDLLMAGIESKRAPVDGLFRKACSTDLLFLIDTTASMTNYINAAKEQIRYIVANIKATFANETEVRLAVVGYKDHDEQQHIQFRDFTTSVEKVDRFLDTLYATGGGDEAEDVLSGIQQAVNANWQQATRCVIHIGDAPAHGEIHHASSQVGDSYATKDEPHGLQYEVLIKKMIQLNINYAFLRINHTTDKMVSNFHSEYLNAGADCLLLNDNVYRSDGSSRYGSASRQDSCRSAKSKLMFEEALLGTAYQSLRHLVVRVVSTSASRTAVRLSSSSSSSRTEKSGFAKKFDWNLNSIKEDDNVDECFEAKPEKPSTDPNHLDQTLAVEGFSPQVVVHNSKTLDKMLQSDDNIILSLTELTVHKASHPFARGAMREAFHATTAASTNKYVIKSYIRSGKKLAHFAEDMQSQALCKAFALEFNAYAYSSKACTVAMDYVQLDFIVTTCLKDCSQPDLDGACMSLEPYVERKYIKYNNNCGYVNRHDPGWFNDSAQAFSHFTFERSQGQFLVCDLQGAGGTLTDPAIHSLNPTRFRLSDTNLGLDGQKLFFASHSCNKICTKLGLKSDIKWVGAGRNDFKTDWPSVSSTVCCSNKLCGRIVHLNKANRISEFPGYHWCNACWSQLIVSRMKKACVSEAADVHGFYVNDFFYESQGRHTPRLCKTHQTAGEDLEKAAVITRKAVLAGDLWARMKGVTRRGSMAILRR